VHDESEYNTTGWLSLDIRACPPSEHWMSSDHEAHNSQQAVFCVYTAISFPVGSRDATWAGVREKHCGAHAQLISQYVYEFMYWPLTYIFAQSSMAAHNTALVGVHVAAFKGGAVNTINKNAIVNKYIIIFKDFPANTSLFPFFINNPCIFYPFCSINISSYNSIIVKTL
jgi:hypothetical protein